MKQDTQIKVSAPKIVEYRLMYRFGAWVTRCRIFAEDDAEAIHDASEEYSNSPLPAWPYEVALFCGNRKVKAFKEASPGMYQEIKTQEGVRA